VCSSELALDGDGLACPDCGGAFGIEGGVPRMLDDRLPGMAEKRREIDAWPAKAKEEGWYGEDDATDLLLPAVPWDDPTWSANEHSFNLLLRNYVKPGQRVLEVGAARCWGALHMVPRGVDYVATDILADPVIGLGRGEFYERHVGPFERVQADGENLPFADGSFDLVVTRIAPHHFEDVPAALAEMARISRDLVVVEDTLYVSEAVEEAEILRDPTHIRSYSEAEWRGFLESAGLAVEEVERFEKRHPLEEWLARTGTSEEDGARVRELLAEQIEGDEYVDTKLVIRGRKPA